MFTGIVTAVGRVATAQSRGSGRRIAVEVPARFMNGVKRGDSIACSGVCLTVAAKKSGRFDADLSAETLRATTAGGWNAGTRINLEKALTLSQPLGGHLVSGHVDGVAQLKARKRAGRFQEFQFAVSPDLRRYIARKGSVCLDGISLTVNKINGLRFTLMLVPHTLGHTTLGQLRPGDRVNLEVDLVARYLEQLQS